MNHKAIIAALLIMNTSAAADTSSLQTSGMGLLEKGEVIATYGIDHNVTFDVSINKLSLGISRNLDREDQTITFGLKTTF